MVKSRQRTEANGASEAFLNSQLRIGSEANAPNGKARHKAGNPTSAAQQYRAHDQAQPRLDPFGPAQEWSKVTEHWSLLGWQAINAILFNGNSDPQEFLLCYESRNATE